MSRALRNTPYDRADGRDESDPEGYSAMLAAQSRVSAPTVFGSVVAFAKGVVARAKSGSPPAGIRPPPPPVPVKPVTKAPPATLLRGRRLLLR